MVFTFFRSLLSYGLRFQVCDGSTSASVPCDDLCGGAGCGKCGGLSCLNGALSKAEEAVKSARAADKMLVEKDREAEQVMSWLFVCLFI